MTGTARVTPAILDALALAPMDLEALLHEIGCTKRGLSIALAHLRTHGKIDRDDRGCYRLSAPAEQPPVEAVPAAAPPAAGSATQVERTDAGWRALGPTTASPAIGTADLVLQVPVEPTEDMLFAAEMSTPRGYRDLYRAMLDAALPPAADAMRSVLDRQRERAGRFLRPAAPQPAADAPKSDWNAVESVVEEYIAGYAMEGDEGIHTPTENERLLIADAIHGLLADDGFMRVIAPLPAADAVSDAMVEAAARAFWGADMEYMFAPIYRDKHRDKMRRAIAAALAARGK